MDNDRERLKRLSKLGGIAVAKVRKPAPKPKNVKHARSFAQVKAARGK